jgi:hypothetical protein
MGLNPQFDKNETKKKNGAQLTDIQEFCIYLFKGLLFAGFFCFWRHSSFHYFLTRRNSKSKALFIFYYY